MCPATWATRCSTCGSSRGARSTCRGCSPARMSWQEFWNANIFHPEPLALTFSEHLFGQSLQILPVYWLTGNIILCYNLVFLSTFALSAFGTYLLVRDLTGDRHARRSSPGSSTAFCRIASPRCRTCRCMSSQWMPFALYGLNRFVDDRIAPRARRRHRRARDAELVVRLLPALLRAVRAAVRDAPHVDGGQAQGSADVDAAWPARRRSRCC